MEAQSAGTPALPVAQPSTHYRHAEHGIHQNRIAVVFIHGYNHSFFDGIKELGMYAYALAHLVFSNTHYRHAEHGIHQNQH